MKKLSCVFLMILVVLFVSSCSEMKDSISAIRDYVGAADEEQKELYADDEDTDYDERGGNAFDDDAVYENEPGEDGAETAQETEIWDHIREMMSSGEYADNQDEASSFAEKAAHVFAGVVSGHGDSEYKDNCIKLMSDIGIAYRDISLDDPVDDDCAFVYLLDPSEDITRAELTVLGSYAEKGGRILLMTDPRHYSSGEMPNLTELAYDFGMQPLDGLIVEGDKNRYMQYPYILIPDYEEPDLLNGYVDLSRLLVLLPLAHGIREYGANGTVIPLLTASEEAYAKEVHDDMNLTKEDDDVTGSFCCGAVGERTDGSLLVWLPSAGVYGYTESWEGNTVFMCGILRFLIDY